MNKQEKLQAKIDKAKDIDPKIKEIAAEWTTHGISGLEDAKVLAEKINQAYENSGNRQEALDVIDELYGAIYSGYSGSDEAVRGAIREEYMNYAAAKSRGTDKILYDYMGKNYLRISADEMREAVAKVRQSCEVSRNKADAVNAAAGIMQMAIASSSDLAVKAVAGEALNDIFSGDVVFDRINPLIDSLNELNQDRQFVLRYPEVIFQLEKTAKKCGISVQNPNLDLSVLSATAMHLYLKGAMAADAVRRGNYLNQICESDYHYDDFKKLQSEIVKQTAGEVHAEDILSDADAHKEEIAALCPPGNAKSIAAGYINGQLQHSETARAFLSTAIEFYQPQRVGDVPELRKYYDESWNVIASNTQLVTAVQQNYVSAAEAYGEWLINKNDKERLIQMVQSGIPVVTDQFIRWLDQSFIDGQLTAVDCAACCVGENKEICKTAGAYLGELLTYQDYDRLQALQQEYPQLKKDTLWKQNLQKAAVLNQEYQKLCQQKEKLPIDELFAIAEKNEIAADAFMDKLMQADFTYLPQKNKLRVSFPELAEKYGLEQNIHQDQIKANRYQEEQERWREEKRKELNQKISCFDKNCEEIRDCTATDLFYCSVHPESALLNGFQILEHEMADPPLIQKTAETLKSVIDLTIMNDKPKDCLRSFLVNTYATITSNSLQKDPESLTSHLLLDNMKGFMRNRPESKGNYDKTIVMPLWTMAAEHKPDLKPRLLKTFAEAYNETSCNSAYPVLLSQLVKAEQSDQLTTLYAEIVDRFSVEKNGKIRLFYEREAMRVAEENPEIWQSYQKTEAAKNIRNLRKEKGYSEITADSQAMLMAATVQMRNKIYGK